VADIIRAITSNRRPLVGRGDSTKMDISTSGAVLRCIKKLVQCALNAYDVRELDSAEALP
jgi:hypothetical protein